MTQEIAEAMTQLYGLNMEHFNKFFDEGNIEKADNHLNAATSLSVVLCQLGYEFKETWDGKYVIVKK